MRNDPDFQDEPMGESSMNFQHRVERLYTNVRSGRDPGYDATTSELFIANVFNLFPGRTVDEMSRMAREAYCAQKRGVIELDCAIELTPTIEIHQEPGFDLGRDQAIFCAFHHGAYRLISHVLMSLGYKVTIIMDRAVAERSEEEFGTNLAEHARREELSLDTFSFRDTSDVGLMRGMLRDLKQGRVLLLYLDGNTGINKKVARDDHTVDVTFLGKQLHSRVGIPALASLAKVPVVPVKMIQSDEDMFWNRVEFSAPIHPQDEERDAYIKRTLQILWGTIEQQVAIDPCRWESLRYSNKYIDMQSGVAPSRITGKSGMLQFDHERFALRTDLAENMLFDRQNYLLYGIGDMLTGLLRSVREQDHRDIREMGLSPEVLNWMHKHEFIRPSEGL